MNAAKLALRGLRFYWRNHLGVLLGVAVGTAILCGALLVGDSVRGSLVSIARRNIGQVKLALHGTDRFFLDDLAGKMQASAGAAAAEAVLVRGVAADVAGTSRADPVQVLGVDESFWQAYPTAPVAIPADSVLLNAPLAAQLGVGPGQEIILRVEKPSLLPRDAAWALEEDARLSFRLTVAGVVDDAQFGRFNLLPGQAAPFNAFVNRQWLGRQIGQAGQANLLLLSGEVDAAKAKAALREHAALTYGGLELLPLESDGAQLQTGRVFLPTAVATAARDLGAERHLAAQGVLTYFVNEIRHGQRSTPYSMVAAMDRPAEPGSAGASTSAANEPTGPEASFPPPMAEDEIVINDWLAEDLQAKAGDEVELAYFVLGPLRKLEQASRTFRVAAVVPMAGPAADRSLMPEFPGIADVPNCRDWRPGVPIDLARIRTKDENYWNTYRGTPKAFVRLSAGQAMWANRYGDLTAIRYFAPAGAAMDLPALRGDLDKALQAAGPAVCLEDVAGRMLSSAGRSGEFGPLFVGFSFFLIASALLLMGLLLGFGLQNRGPQVGTLLALGLGRGQVKRVLLLEHGVLAVVGVVVGAALSVGYTALMIRGMRTIWSGAFRLEGLAFHVQAATLGTGIVLSLAMCLLVMVWVLRRHFAHQVRELLQGGPTAIGAPGRAFRWRNVLLGVVLAAAVVAGAYLAMVRIQGRPPGTLVRFGVAIVLLGLLVLAQGLWLYRSSRAGVPGAHQADLLRRGSARRPGRNLAIIVMMALGSFAVLSVDAFAPPADSRTALAGSGGFDFIGQSSLPMLRELNEKGLEQLGLDGQAARATRVVPIRVQDGEDASCLNLGQVQRPRVLGVRVEDFRDSGFVFAQVQGGSTGWDVLAARLADGAIPTIVDETTAEWILQKKLGDRIAYTDDHGRAFDIQIAGILKTSILQGSLLIADGPFLEKFPSTSGYRMMLVKVGPGLAKDVSAQLTKSLADSGLELIPAGRRLAELAEVERVYMSVFQVLGGLGVILGTAGLALVVLRNILERRGELAMLRAIGFSKAQLRQAVTGETVVLAGSIPFWVLGITLLLTLHVPARGLVLAAGLAVSAAVWTTLAAVWALRGKCLDGLRNE